MGNEYLASLDRMGIDPSSDVAKSICFTLGVGSNYFFEIAKMRAARLLWAQ